MRDLNYDFIGIRLKREREKKNITQEKLAEMVGCSTAHISHIETGNTIPSLKIMINIINQLRISSDLILCDYLENVNYVFENEMSNIIEGCTENEVKFIVESAKENLRIFRKYEGKKLIR